MPQQQDRSKPKPKQQPEKAKHADPSDGLPPAHPSHVCSDFVGATRFEDAPFINKDTKRAIKEKFGYENMTTVQASAMQPASEGNDILAKARTGTGKTFAFLIPTIERLNQLHKERAGTKGIGTLVLSPTRELAMQIHDECARLLAFQPHLKVCVVYGGTNIRGDQRNLSANVDFLIATPGRLIDHIDNTKGFVERLQGVKILTMDEADRMLDMGFRPAIEKIMSNLPAPNTGRQTLLFSATVPPELVQIVPKLIATSFHFIDTVGGTVQVLDQKGGAGKQALIADDPIATVSQVEQDFVVSTLVEQIPAVAQLLDREIAMNPTDHKIIVFFTTARVTQLFAELFNVLGYKVLEIHSRKSQPARLKASETFRDAKCAIMFSSDVTARGLDYPDVTYVLQVGLPSDKEQYIHRLGRTARAGKKGRGTILLSDFEQFFLRKSLSDLPLRDALPDLPEIPQDLVDGVGAALARVSMQTKATAYCAWLGFYNSVRGLGWSKPELVQQANFFATQCLLLPSPPEMQAKTIGKMGLKGVPGLVIEKPGGGRGGGGGGGFGRGGRGGRGGFQQHQQQQQQQPGGHQGGHGFDHHHGAGNGSVHPHQHYQQQPTRYSYRSEGAAEQAHHGGTEHRQRGGPSKRTRGGPQHH